MARLTIEYEGSLHKSLALMSGTLGLDMCKAFDSKPGEHSIEVLGAAETLFDDLATLGDAIDEVAAYLEGKDLLNIKADKRLWKGQRLAQTRILKEGK